MHVLTQWFGLDNTCVFDNKAKRSTIIFKKCLNFQNAYTNFKTCFLLPNKWFAIKKYSSKFSLRKHTTKIGNRSSFSEDLSTRSGIRRSIYYNVHPK